MPHMRGAGLGAQRALPGTSTYRGLSHHPLAVVDPHDPLAAIPLQQDTGPGVEGNWLFTPGVGREETQE